ncbi:protein yellow-like [Agrilus planipennis]|uniref:Protein yellow-like n=1 Tax=Agrilus planipennis TaxID=224129 RepID=A0A1W4X3L4_AGRPL|nr:protein yellow-like [Agrilus planipennis]
MCHVCIISVILLVSLDLTYSSQQKLEIQFEWSFINFTWPSSEIYNQAISTRTYIPENNCLAGLKIFDKTMYVSLPRSRPGTPVTLATIFAEDHSAKINPILKPYPNWEMNQLGNCTALQNVQSMEIDPDGVMWILDGTRVFQKSKCPPKIVLLDLKNNGKVVYSIEISEKLCPQDECFLNDIVVDGDYAFISEHSQTDPGIVVFNRKQNKLWKARDKSMFAEISSPTFSVGGKEFNKLGNVDGIALSPTADDKLIYYCALTALNQYAIKASVLKDEELLKGNDWRREVKTIGKKPALSDGLIADNEGNLYFTFINDQAIGKWNTSLPLNNDTIEIYKDEKMLWPDTFAFDDTGHLFVTATQVHKYFDPDYNIEMNDEIKIRIFKLQTNSKSYLYH